MKNFLYTGWKMLRYRSVLVLVLFMLLSVALYTNGQMLPLQYELAGIVILAFSYLCATCVNDLVDWKIDQVNLKGNAERPLVTGRGTRSQLIILAIIGGVVAIGLGALIDPRLGVIMVVSIFLNTFYSLPPIQVSYRPLLTPFYLAFCYVVVSFIVGFVLSNIVSPGGEFQWLYLISFYLFFVARISLKDFRDRKGDAAAGKATIILKYGKGAVCILSASSAVVASMILAIATWGNFYMLALVVAFIVSILIIEYRLYRTSTLDMELLTIAYGARMGNGLLLAFLGLTLLEGQHATRDVLFVFTLTMAGLYGYMFWMYLHHADDFRVSGRKLRIK